MIVDFDIIPASTLGLMGNQMRVDPAWDTPRMIFYSGKISRATTMQVLICSWDLSVKKMW